MTKATRTTLGVVLVVAALWVGYSERTTTSDSANSAPSSQTQTTSADPAARAYAARISGEMMHVDGTVTKVLSDDLKGDRHQRFLMRTHTNHSLLVAHNIDIAPRVAALERGDAIELYGQYEWNDKGGVMHWTHHAPRGDHEGGWIKHNGQIYQ